MLDSYVPTEFRDLTTTPLPKARNRWGDVRPKLIDVAIGARRVLREALGMSGSRTGDLHVVLLGSTVRNALGAATIDLYRWYRLPRSENVLGELFLAAIPHPSPIASRVFDRGRVARLFRVLRYAETRHPSAARDCRMINEFDLAPLER